MIITITSRKMNGKISCRLFAYVGILLAFLATAANSQLSDEVDVTFHGAGWIQGGRIMAISDSISDTYNYEGNWIQSTGALFNGHVQIDKEFSGEFGIGAVKAHNPMGNISNYANINGFQSTFLNIARISYTMGGDDATTPLKITAGLFSYKYDNNIKNLGLYLIRGSVNPGTVISGFETKEMLPSANLQGLHMRNNFGPNFSQDLLITSETDIKPLFDLSFIYIASYKLDDFLELGAGVNFYHYLPINSAATSPSEEFFDRSSKDDIPVALEGTEYEHTYGRNFVFDVIDTITTPGSPDTTTYMPSHKGIKAMARASLDLKPLFGLDLWHPKDLLIYSEVAAIGIGSEEAIYGSLASRMPIVFGMYIPSWFLNELVLEIEYFGAEYNPDYSKIMESGSPIPRGNYYKRADIYNPANELTYPYNTEKDNLKWSLYGVKVLANHIAISAQIASDHTRLSASQPYFTHYNETFVRPQDWYWMLKLTFFL